MTINNSTITTFQHYYYNQIESINESTVINVLTSIDYDPIGAAYFMIIVLLWYSISVVGMLGMQIRTRTEIIEDCIQRRVKLFIKTLRDQTQTKQILEELVDKQKRDKLWKIYFGKTYNKNDKLKHAEILRIKNIKKQLAIVNHNHMIMNDTFISPIVNHCIHHQLSNSRSKFISKFSSIENQKCIRHRSSFNRQIIQRWKLIIDQNKAYRQQIPWTIKKIFIHRYFQRYYQNSLLNIPTMESVRTYQYLETIDNKQCHLLSPSSSHKKINNNSCQIIRKIDKPLNPYITYFHLPINENFKTNIQNLPCITTVKSNHHIVQMNHDESPC
ncbi:unnamed protein product [Rotaria sordida]|uniref:Uncharacterized protein n=1 Tax=Rotaria sordida TaxID=392033 RepID=A0A813RB85_9BILA|nr:unnamed protein product [Rotaria sordida]CAF3531202.1 unnamed protein product [Rotaria sordida]